MARTAGQVATPTPLAVDPGMLAARALALMNDRQVQALIVVERGRPVGVVRLHDCLRAGVA